MSGCSARVVPTSSRANAQASARLPTPCGPWKRYACAGPSSSAASSSRFASAARDAESRQAGIMNLLCDLRARLLSGAPSSTT